MYQLKMLMLLVATQRQSSQVEKESGNFFHFKKQNKRTVVRQR